MPSENLKRLARRSIDDHDRGEPLELIQYQFPRDDDGDVQTDGWGDPLPPDETHTDVRGTISRPNEARLRQEIQGSDASIDLVVHISSEHAPLSTLASVAADGPERAAELVRANGDILRAIDAHDEGNGLIRLDTTVVSRGPGGAIY